MDNENDTEIDWNWLEMTLNIFIHFYPQDDVSNVSSMWFLIDTYHKENQIKNKIK